MEITRQNLLEYLNAVIALERDRYELRRVIEITTEMKLHPSGPPDRPAFYQNKPDRPKEPVVSADAETLRGWASRGLALVIIPALAAMIAIGVNYTGEGSWAIGIFTAVCMIAAACAIAVHIMRGKEQEKLMEVHQKRIHNYRLSVKRYKDERNSYKNRLKEYSENVQKVQEKNDGIKQINSMIDLAVGFLKVNEEELAKTIQRYYSVDIIHKKYWNLIAATSIYDYFDTGRCDALTGPHGAYNLFEQESRMDIIITKLGQILSSLHRIEQNQYKLYEAVSVVNKNVEGLRRELHEGIKWISGNYQEVASAISKHDGSIKSMSDTMNHGFSNINTYIDRLTDVNQEALSRLPLYRQ